MDEKVRKGAIAPNPKPVAIFDPGSPIKLESKDEIMCRSKGVESPERISFKDMLERWENEYDEDEMYEASVFIAQALRHDY